MGLVIAGLQHEGVLGDPAANLALLDAAAASAAAAGVDVLVTTEMFLTGYNLGADLDALVVRDPDAPISDIAARHGIAIVAGLPERAGTDDPGDAADGAGGARGVFNSALFVGADGAVLARYRKAHLFGELDRAMFLPGDELCPVFDYRGIRICLMICYDVEFPETVRSAALAGADLVLVPTAQMEPFAFLAESLIRVRAWENQVYIAYINHTGHERGLRYVGLSSIVAPSGEVLASLGPDDSGLLMATVDAGVVADARRQNPYLTDLRPALYPRGATFSHQP